MTAAAIMGTLVDARNVGAHKSVKLTIHVPAEQAMQVFQAFGWPTMADPVMVAVAALDLDKTVKPRARVAPDKRLAQKSGIACADPVFQRFLLERDLTAEHSEESAVQAVYAFCAITSRSQIVPGSEAATLWDDLYGQFIAWREAE